jgi:hypothetical protein
MPRLPPVDRRQMRTAGCHFVTAFKRGRIHRAPRDGQMRHVPRSREARPSLCPHALPTPLPLPSRLPLFVLLDGRCTRSGDDVVSHCRAWHDDGEGMFDRGPGPLGSLHRSLISHTQDAISALLSQKTQQTGESRSRRGSVSSHAEHFATRCSPAYLPT